MTEQELVQLEALAKAATPGPWESDAFWCVRAGPRGILADLSASPSHMADGDAAYIAAMHPQTTLALIAEVRRLDALLTAAFGVLQNGDNAHGAGSFWDLLGVAEAQRLDEKKRKALGEP